MTAVNNASISSSCQSLSTGLQISGIGSGLRSGQYINGTGSLGRLKFHKSLGASDEELEYSQLSQSTHIIGRVKSERFLASRSDEDRRRRTIIVEKKKDSYGFTLQSYGIHYKKDEEIEMITYVDYVEYDGPAYKAGMREGDVILSINGVDMEKADHKTLVDFIKACDTRMRMVVQFEDCVRKVDLHMRYMQLQGMLQSKMNELERICLRERELLEGRWKTHSLPARKKATTSPTDVDIGVTPTNTDIPSYYRPTLSTEDVAITMRNHHSLQAIIPPPAQFMLSYHYLDPNYRYILKPSSSNSSGEYFVAIGNGIQRSPSDHHVILTRTESADTTHPSGLPSYSSIQQTQTQTQIGTGGATTKPPAPPPRTCEKHKPPNKQQQEAKTADSGQQKGQKPNKHSCHGHSCNPCIGHFRWKSAEKAAAAAAAAAGAGGNGDNVSLDAYDLASPCCDAHCVPTRRRARHHKEHIHKHKYRDRERDPMKQRAVSAHGNTEQLAPTAHYVGHHHHHPQQQHHHHHHQHATNTADSKQQQMQQQQQQHQQYHQQYYAHQQQKQQQQQQQQLQHSCDNGSIRSRYFDLATGLASQCSLHSCTSSELAATADATSYATSLSTDTLYWDPKSDNAQSSRHHSIKSRQSYQQQSSQPTQQQQQQPQPQQQPQQPQQKQLHQMHGIYQQRYHITATQIQPSQVYPHGTAFVQKPKSWDNLTTKSIGGYGFGYGYLDTVTVKPTVKLQIAQQRHSMPRKNAFGRFSTYTDVENYAPPPSQFVEELTTTTMTTITAKSTEELIACDCLSTQQQQQQKQQQQQAIKIAQMQIGQSRQLSHQTTCQMGGYYSHLPRPTTDAATSTVSEVTRL